MMTTCDAKSMMSCLQSVFETADQHKNNWPDWLKELKSKNANSFLEAGLPDTKDEDFKYTSLKAFSQTNWQFAEPGAALFEFALPEYSTDSIRIVLVNGRFDRNLSNGSALGLHYCSLRDAILERPEVSDMLDQAKSHSTQVVGRTIEPDRYPFGELNTACFVDGVFIEIEEDCKIGSIIEIVHVASTGAFPSLSTPRILVHAQKNSQSKIIETYITDENCQDAVISVTECFVRENATLEHVRVQDQGEKSYSIAVWQVMQETSSNYVAFNVCFGSTLGRVDQNFWIGGETCETRLDGVVCASNNQILDNHTRLDHAFPHCNSFEIYKQIIKDEATVVFNGKIFVHQDAQKTDAKQTNQALLLSPKATINSKPQLEIFADDVKCTHGATVGQLEDSPLFYMRSRGISEESAQAVLVYAFAAEVLELISEATVSKALETKLYQKLGIDLS